jgi:hypothetical protein
MRRAIAVLVFGMLLAMPHPAAANPQSDPSSGDPAQGVPPPPDDPFASQRSAEKLARVQALAATSSGPDLVEAITGQRPISITADSIGDDYAEITMPVWQEPQGNYYQRNPANWCGPGATSNTVSRWSYMFGRGDEVAAYPGGHEAYQNYLANTLNEMVWCDGGLWCTTYPGLANVTNQAAQAGGFYLESGWINGLTHYKSMLRADLHDTNVPLMPVVWTQNLPGWAGVGVTHWVTVKQYWDGGNTTTYGDTAGPYQRTSNPYGWHVVNLDWFYAQIQAAYNDIVW